MSDNATIPARQLRGISRALPFWISALLPPIAWIGAIYGGWTVLLLPVVAWYLFSILDTVIGATTDNGDLEASDDDLFWYRLITLIWAPLQFMLLFSLLWYVPQADHLGSLERIALFFGVGVITGTIGINYSHELMHQKSRLERWMADLLLAMVLYSHFRSEHLLVHHVYVGTPADPVTARYNESFFRFYPRVLRQCLNSAFDAERAKLARKNQPWHHPSNPFFRYWALQAAMLGLAFGLGGWSGIGLFLVQAGTAVWQLELVNYLEHYGLTRRHLGAGKYEPVKTHHSWNSDQRVSNWLLINLQRHADHHYHPNRRFPVLQTYAASQAPQLPFGYPVMTIAAMIPPLWRRIMNPRVDHWRAAHYADITDWRVYNNAGNPSPR